MDVRKAVIPAAGLGTRQLPTSKAVPKELLPLIDRPMLHYIVEEALDAGLSQMIIVTSQGKDAMANYFDPAPNLEELLERRGETSLAAAMRRFRLEADFIFMRQHQQLGLGHAVYTARHAVGDEPFAVMLPDDVIGGGDAPAIGELLETASACGASVVAVEQVPAERISSYGVVTPGEAQDGAIPVRGLVEKPPAHEAPSDLGIVGRYVLTPEIFGAMARVTPGAGGELQLTDGIGLLLEEQPVYARRFTGTRYDAGTPMGMLRASVSLALRRTDVGPAFRAWLQAELEDA